MAVKLFCACSHHLMATRLSSKAALQPLWQQCQQWLRAAPPLCTGSSLSTYPPDRPAPSERAPAHHGATGHSPSHRRHPARPAGAALRPVPATTPSPADGSLTFILVNPPARLLFQSNSWCMQCIENVHCSAVPGSPTACPASPTLIRSAAGPFGNLEWTRSGPATRNAVFPIVIA